MKLSTQQLQRQDFVDSIIYYDIKELIPSKQKHDWGIESIAKVRDTTCLLLVEKGICSEQYFYPFINE